MNLACLDAESKIAVEIFKIVPRNQIRYLDLTLFAGIFRVEKKGRNVMGNEIMLISFLVIFAIPRSFAGSIIDLRVICRNLIKIDQNWLAKLKLARNMTVTVWPRTQDAMMTGGHLCCKLQ